MILKMDVMNFMTSLGVVAPHSWSSRFLNVRFAGVFLPHKTEGGGKLRLPKSWRELHSSGLLHRSAQGSRAVLQKHFDPTSQKIL